MDKKRRNILVLGLTLFSGIPFVRAEVRLKKKIDRSNWRGECRRWLRVLIPADEYGEGADTPEVWHVLEELVGDSKFARGFFSGMELLSYLEVPKNEDTLTKLMASGTVQAKFLNAFLEIVIEAYYGAEVGWQGLGIDNPPQPLGYLNVMVKVD